MYKGVLFIMSMPLLSIPLSSLKQFNSYNMINQSSISFFVSFLFNMFVKVKRPFKTSEVTSRLSLLVAVIL